MKLKSNIGQIFLTHPRDENYTSIYEEAFSKQGETVELLAVLEVTAPNPELIKTHLSEYEKLGQTLVSSFKKTYVAAPFIDKETFERGLAAVNAALSRLAAKGRVNWYGRFHAVIGAIWKNHLYLSSTGTGLAYLVRKNDLSLLSDGLAGETTKAVKIFANFASGQLAAGDRVALSTHQLFNYLSLDRFREFLREDSLEETCQEIINALKDIKDAGFSTFIFELQGPGQKASAVRLASAPKTSLDPRNKSFQDILQIILFVAVSIGSFLSRAVSATVSYLANLSGKRPKKSLFMVLAVVLILLLASIGYAAVNKLVQSRRQSAVSTVSAAESKLNEAEAALIYKDDNRTQKLINEAEKLIAAASLGKDQKQPLADRLTALKNKVNREQRIDSPLALTEYPSLPTNLLRSPNGFLGFNHDSGTLSFYDFRLGSAKFILLNQNTSDLAAASYAGSDRSYLFLSRDGKFKKLAPPGGSQDPDNFADVPLGENSALSAEALRRIRILTLLDEGATSRIYLLDNSQNQIWRTRLADGKLGPADKWLKSPAVFDGARDMAVDGSIYFLYADRAEKYFSGQKQAFDLPVVSPQLTDARRIFTKTGYQNLYITDPQHSRILVVSKQGKLESQIISDKFRALADIYVDEAARIIYALAGNELLQVNYK